MLDARTGEILALANQPSFNPNELDSGGARREAQSRDHRLYEPGSTVKPLTVLAALESGRFSEDSVIDTTPGYMRVGRMLVKDPINRGSPVARRSARAVESGGYRKIAMALDERTVFDAFVRAGFADLTSCGLPGEVDGRVPDSQLKNPIVRATLAYGYGLTVTPLQLAQAYLMFATGGIRLPISILRRERPRKENVRSITMPSQSIVRMMKGVDSVHGTAPKARVAGYEIAGKTGTARKVGPNGYDDERHVAFFAGLAPADDPRVVVDSRHRRAARRKVRRRRRCGPGVRARRCARAACIERRTGGGIVTEPSRFVSASVIVLATSAVVHWAHGMSGLPA